MSLALQFLVDPSTSAGPVSGTVAGGDQQEIVVLADVHRETWMRKVCLCLFK